MRVLPTLLLVACMLAPISCGTGGGGGDGGCTPSILREPGLVRGPAVSLPAPDGATIVWTSESVQSGRVEWGSTSAYDDAASDPTPRTVHALRLTSLEPGSVVHYRILHGGTPVGGDRTFRTPPSRCAPVRFAVLGDSGTGCPEALAVRDRVVAFDADFVLHTGDVAYDAGTEQQVDAAFTRPYAALLASRPVFVAWGNHDVRTNGGRPLDDAVLLPTNPQGSERWYAFDWGDVHVVALDTNASTAPGSPQRVWLEADLAASGARWTIVFHHHPAYSSSRHGGDAAVVANLVPLYDAAGVDLVLTGHDHAYERTHPMRGGVAVPTSGAPDYVDPPGTVYVVTGGGGAELYAVGSSGFTARAVSIHHACVVEVADSTLTLQAIAVDGTTIDACSLTKTR